jgi:hypothetical protein
VIPCIHQAINCMCNLISDSPPAQQVQGSQALYPLHGKSTFPYHVVRDVARACLECVAFREPIRHEVPHFGPHAPGDSSELQPIAQAVPCRTQGTSQVLYELTHGSQPPSGVSFYESRMWCLLRAMWSHQVSGSPKAILPTTIDRLVPLRFLV